MSCIPASSGVKSPFFALHLLHAVTRLSQEWAPPLELGTTWSSVKSFLVPQNWHSKLSRLKIFCRVRFTPLYGAFTYRFSRITEGIGKVRVMEWSLCPLAGRTISLLLRYTSINARSTEQTISGLKSWLSTNTRWFMMGKIKPKFGFIKSVTGSPAGGRLPVAG